MGALQLFGVNLGYVCDCRGTVEIVDTQYCVGPHGDDCHTAGHDEHNEGERKDHDSVNGDIQSAPMPTVVISVPQPAMLFILPALILPASPASQVAAKFYTDVHGGSPLGLAIQRTVVLLL